MPQIRLGESEHSELAGRVAARLFRRHLAEIDEETLIELVKYGELIMAEPGELLARETGGARDKLFVLLDGSVLVRSGKRIIGRFNHSGDVLGELCILRSPPGSADIVAETSAHAFAIPTAVLGREEFLAPAATLYQALSYSLANCLRALSAQVVERIDRSSANEAIDASTGLATRRRLEEVINLLATARNGLPFSVTVTELRGDGGPDELVRFAGILRKHVRTDDLAAHLDGRQFAVVLPNCDAANARNVASSLRDALAREQAGGGVFGVATWAGEEPPIGVLERACAALKRGGGRGSVVSSE